MRKGGVVLVMVAVICMAGQVQAQLTCTGTVFNDVNNITQPSFCGWIERFFTFGITSGCQVDDPTTPDINERMYCPWDFVTRGQMAVFLTKALSESPGAVCMGSVFNDVNASMNGGESFCRYIQ